MTVPPYAYLTGVLFFGAIWLVLFVVRKDLRREMLVMSVLVAPLGPLSELFYLRDYWAPQLIGGVSIGLEDLFFSFFIGGIAGVLYEVLAHRSHHHRTHTHFRRWLRYAVLSGALWMVLANIVLGLNSIYASSIGFFILGCSVIVLRRDLARDAMMSGLLMGCLLLLFYALFSRVYPGVIQAWWHLRNISGILILGAPLEELLWGFSWGFLAGPAYELVAGMDERNL